MSQSLTYLVDGSGFIFRAYHALPPLKRGWDGLPTGAVSGFCSMLYRLVYGMKKGFAPTHVLVVFDPPGGSFRNTLYPPYKSHRPPAPEDLIVQFDLVHQAVEAFSIAHTQVLGFEADDVIASYAQALAEEGRSVRIVSSDKDLMQLVRPGVTLYDPMKDKEIDEDGVVEKFGVPPSGVVAVQALAGDSSDNIPGVPGIGIKTASQLIAQYHTLENLLTAAPDMPPSKRRDQLIAHQDTAHLCTKLVRLRTDVPLPIPFEDLKIRALDPALLLGFFKTLELHRLVKQIAGDLGALEDAHPPLPVRVSWEGSTEEDRGTEEVDSAAEFSPLDPATYETVQTQGALEAWVQNLSRVPRFAIDTETTGLDPLRAELVGISLAVIAEEPLVQKQVKACYIPLGHRTKEGLFEGEQSFSQLTIEAVIGALKPLLEDPAVLKIGHNIKYDAHILAQHGCTLRTLDDTMLMSYALGGGLHGHGMDDVSKRELGHSPIAFSDLVGKGKAARTFAEVPLGEATRYAAEDADITLRLWHTLRPKLWREGLVTVYETLERPLVPVVFAMEEHGVLIDPLALKALSQEFSQKANLLAEDAYALCQETFNLASPKQLGEILFGKMGLEGGKKTPKGAWSTDGEVLETLAQQGVVFAEKVLEWRQVMKLKSTYTDALPGHIHPKTGRVHTSYGLASTTTGRLSSNDPNLQNIPIRTEEGRAIRRAFIAPPSMTLLSADYSQIELRLLAHMADIPSLKKAFREGVDIHALTASEMFHVPLEDMDSETRRRAKAINFGIIYGISAFGLAKQLGISREEAQGAITTYFKRFPEILTYMETTKEKARTLGYVQTLFGRRVHCPGIRSKNPSERAFYERAAINAPLQGSAADLIRRAMVALPKALLSQNLRAQPILQVHDELVFEVPLEETDATTSLVRTVMEQASLPAVSLTVDLEVTTKQGPTWA